jgi:hypothetical protein
MNLKRLLLPLAGAVLLCGCGKQTRLNTEKLIQLQDKQAVQIATLQTQLTALAPMLTRMSGSYFEKTHDDAFFFHTNTLYLLLTVDRKIEAELRQADIERQAEHDLAYSYHTNELRTMYLTIAQIEEDLTAQENRITDKVNAETRKVGLAVNEDLRKQMQLLVPDESEVVQRQAMATDIAQLKRDLAFIKLRLQTTNAPSAQP